MALVPCRYMLALQQKGCPLPNVFGFIDGTCVEVARPVRHQQRLFNGRLRYIDIVSISYVDHLNALVLERCHCVNFQCVTTPDGIIQLACGPFAGTVNDSPAYKGTGWEAKLMQLPMIDGYRPCIYGDSAYGGSPVLLRPTQDTALNSIMSNHRIIVEQSFGKLKTFNAFLSYSRNIRLLVQDVGMYFKVAVILTNAHTCLTGVSAPTSTGGVAPPSLHDYLTVGQPFFVCSFVKQV
jgi:hypothetical protein